MKIGADTEEIYDQVMDGYANQTPAPPKVSGLARTVAAVVILLIFVAAVFAAGALAHWLWRLFLLGWHRT